MDGRNGGTADIEVTRAGGVQIIRFTRPQKKNALTSAMYRAATEALVAGDADAGIVCHAFLGSSGVFTAGNDIGDFLAAARGAGGLGEDVVRFVRLLPLVAKPMIAGVEGHAVGVGTTLLLHCDLVYATPDARFATPFLDLALVPEAGSSLLAAQRMGYARAFEMLVLGEPLGAERAREAGLVNALVSPADLEATVLGAGRRLAAKPWEALIAARRLMRGDASTVLQQIDLEVDAFRRCLTSAEAEEAFVSMLEKRKPDFAAARKRAGAG